VDRLLVHGRRAAMGHVEHFNAGHRFEHLTRKVTSGADAKRCHIDLARIGIGVGDEFRNVFDRDCWMYL
jgi:hypothetical protein